MPHEKNNSPKSLLNFTKLTFNDIMEQINGIVSKDPRFENFKESAIAQTILEVFSGVTDMNNYYIERRAEESYLETAKLKSSVIQLAKQLGYVITRPIPAQTQMSMTIQGGGALGGFVAPGEFIQLNIYKPYSFSGNTYLLANSYKYIFTTTDAVNFTSSSYKKTITFGLLNTENNFNLFKDADLVDETDTVTINLIQGEIKFQDIVGATNDQIDQKFQVYKIDDKEFSDKFGEKDLNVPITRVAVTNVPSNVFSSGIDPGSTEYKIDRRSLVQQGTILQDFNNPEKVCLLRTAIDGAIELLFGDDNFAALGAKSGSGDNIYLQYLATKGAEVNELGIVGTEIKSDDPIFLNNDISKNISANITFNFTSNITQGSNLEDTESIKTQAPGIFQSLDRAVTPDDYIAILKNLTSPINVKNAIAWGEQDEGGDLAPIPKLFNVALFSAFGELYKRNVVDDVWGVKVTDTSPEGELGNAVLDDVDIFTEDSENSYFNLLVREDSPGVSRALEAAHIASSNSKLGNLYTDLNKKSQLTVRNIYISPIIHEFEINGNVYINKLTDATQLNQDIKSAIYHFLNENADYNSDVFLSNLIEIVEGFNGVLYANLTIDPATNTRIKLGTGITGETFEQAISGDSEVNLWTQSLGLATSGDELALAATIGISAQAAYDTVAAVSASDWTELSTNISTSALDNKQFITSEFTYQTFINALFEGLKGVIGGTSNEVFVDQPEFRKLIARIFTSFSFIIKNNLLRESDGSKKGNIINYKLKNEIPRLEFLGNVFFQ